MSFTSPAAMSCSTVSSPRLSMFIALREAKCAIRPAICGGQPYLLGHTHAASPSILRSGVPHAGHLLTNETGVANISRLSTFTPVILGIISPPFSTYTISLS